MTWLKAYKKVYRNNKGDKPQIIKLYGLCYASCNNKQILKKWMYTTKWFSGYKIAMVLHNMVFYYLV